MFDYDIKKMESIETTETIEGGGVDPIAQSIELPSSRQFIPQRPSLTTTVESDLKETGYNWI